MKFLVLGHSTVLPSWKVNCVGNVGGREKILVSLSVQGRRERFKLSVTVNQPTSKASPGGSKNNRQESLPLTVPTVMDSFPSGKAHLPRQSVPDGASVTVTVTEYNL